MGLKRPNGFGLYDMFGSAPELMLDWYGPYPGGTVTDPTGHPTGVYVEDTSFGRVQREPRRVLRGCGYRETRDTCERHDRQPYSTDISKDFGLRVVRVPVSASAKN